MSEYLSTYTIVAIYHFAEEQRHFLTTKSLVKNKTYLSAGVEHCDFENTLFYIEVQGNNMEFNVPIEYDQPIYLRHMISQKYLTLAIDEEEEKEVKYQLVLGTEKKYFWINPCYQYQTKVSTKIKFNEEVYLTTEYTESRRGMVVVENHEKQMQLFLGFNFGSKLQFHFYTLYQKEERYYKHGKIVWLSHIESDNFLSIITLNGKDEVVFEPKQMQKQIQNMAALWTIESKVLTSSQHLKYQEEVRFKNILSGHYLSFSRNYKLVDNQRIYQIYLEEQSTEHSRFLFRPIQDKELKQIDPSSYLLLLHCESNLFLGCRKEKISQDCHKLLTFPYPEDEDLFKLHSFSGEEEQALRFIVAIRGQFRDIQLVTRIPLRDVLLAQVTQIEETYLNIQREFSNLQHLEKLFQFVRNELGPSIRRIASNLNFFRSLSDLGPAASTSSRSTRLKAASTRILTLAYHILSIFCQSHTPNQMISFEYLSSYLLDVGMGVGAESAIMQTFRNNKGLLSRANSSLSEEGNLVRMLLLQFHKKNPTKNNKYWENLQKIIEVLNVLIFHNRSPLDVNQNLISQELFKNGFYQMIILPIQVHGPRIVIFDPESRRNVPIENINNPHVNNIVELLLLLFSNLTRNHSFNSKNYIHSYLAETNQACLSVMISYLNKPIPKPLYNQLLNFVSHTYLDSSPRLKRIKPLPFIFFNFTPEKTNAELQQGYMSERLREMLILKAEQSKVCKPLHYSNLLPEESGSIAEPSMTEEQLVSFRVNLTQKILRSKDVSEPQLQTISLLMRLECYTMNEVLQLYEQLKRKLILGEVDEKLQPKILGIINQLYLRLLELQMKKMTIYLKYKFMENQKEDLPQNQYHYVLPLSTRVRIPQKIPVPHLQDTTQQQELLESSRSQASQSLIEDYNELRDTLALIHASPQLKLTLVRYFCRFKEDKLKGEEAATYLQSLFNLILKTHLPKLKFLTLLSSSTVLTHEEIGQFDSLFTTSKKLQYLMLISDYWMVGDNEPESCQQFLTYLSELTDFLFEDSEVMGDNYHRKEAISLKRQLFMSSLGVHQMVLELLQKNAYLVSHIQNKKDLPRKFKEIFEACFQFVYCFIRQCSENKTRIESLFPILLLYENTIQLGQLKIYTQFFRDQKHFVKELNFAFVENTIMRIIKAKEGRDMAEYNPDYLQLIIVMINSLDVESRFFVDQLYQLISKPDIFKRLLFLEEGGKGKGLRFCLNMHKIRLEPLQLPLLYHKALLSLFELILQSSTQSIKNSFKLKLTQTFRVDYLFSILQEPDIFSNTGILPQLNHLLKQQIHTLINIHLEKTELATQICQSQTLLELVQYWDKWFIKQPERKEMTVESESFYLPFLKDLGDSNLTLEKNRENNYHQYIRPLIDKLIPIFQKQKTHSQPNTHTLRKYLNSLHENLQQTFKNSSNLRSGTFNRHYTLKDVKLKWRNFVDDDEDNSKEQKYVKKAILDILKNKQSADYLTQQIQHFYSVIQKDSKAFIGSMVCLLRILFASPEIMQGRKEQSKTALKVLKYLSEYIEYHSNLGQGQEQVLGEVKLITNTLEECKFIEIFTQLTSSKEFELRKRHLKTIFNYCLKIINFLLYHGKQLKFNKLLYKIFKNNPQSYKLLQFLKEGALEIISTIDPHSHHEQINSALSEMRLCVDTRPLDLHQQAYLTLTYLCKYEPFAQFLRNQQSTYNDTDFLDKIYNILMFLFKHSDHTDLFRRSITISSVRAAEQILDFICSMLTGPNASNQNYLIDNKFPQFVLSVLKLQNIPQSDYDFRQERTNLLGKIVEFYRSNGIQIEELLQSKIKLIDFRHVYLLNRLKYILVKLLLDCLVTNENSLVRIKMDLPVQIIKLNLIWVYQTYKKGNYEYEEQLILRERNDWGTLLDQEVDSLYLRLGFYYYQLIELYQDKQVEGESLQSDQKIINEEKEKERIVKKFFAAIKEGRRQKEKEGSLEKQQLREEMKLYFHTYYNAIIFFRKKTGTVEVDLKGQIIKVYFPTLPIAQKITEEMKEEFKIGVNRLTRDQKIKSLIQYQNQFYQDLKGEQDYFNQISRRMPLLGPVLRMMKYEDQFLLVALINSFLNSMLYWLANYEIPTTNFEGQFFAFISSTGNAAKNIVMLLTSLINLLIGFVIGLYLFTRKIPLRKRLLTMKFLDLQQKQKGKADTPTNLTLYVWSNIVKQTAYNVYIVVFLMLTIFHPIFSCFILVEIINRIEMGRFIIRSIKETWSQLFVAIGLLVVFNIIFVQLFYGFYTGATGYGTMCSSQYTCMLLLMDQNLKGGGGVLGNVDSNFNNMVFNTQVLAQILYIVISIKVIAQIFSGTIIDKFSQLREQQQKIEEDRKKICFICAQERFDLDLQYEGFAAHTENNHQTFNYIKYLFYLRRCQGREYGIVERYIQEQRLKDVQKWIPEDNSITKQAKLKEEEEKKGDNDIKDKVMVFVKDKVRDMKRVKQRIQLMTTDLKKENQKALGKGIMVMLANNVS